MKLRTLNELNKGFTEIRRGVWIKHPSIFEDCYLEELTEKFSKLAIKRGLPTEAQSIENAKKSGEWSEQDQKDYDSLSSYLVRLQENYDKVLETQKPYLVEDIELNKKKVAGLAARRAKAVGKTAESFANKMAGERYIMSLFYSSPDESKRIWTDEDIEFAEESEVDQAFTDFHQFRDRFSEEEIKTLACSNYCQNLYMMAKGDLFGKGVLVMTNLQQRFSLYLENYKNIIRSITGKVQDSILEDWKELDKWAKSSEKAREELEKKWGGFQTSNKFNYENIRKAAVRDGEAQNSEATKELLK